MSQRRKILVVFLFLSFSLACNLPENTLKFWIEYLLEPFENSRAQACEESGGAWDIEYNRCDRGLEPLAPAIEEELPSGENPAPAVEPESASPAEVDISALAGTYVGTTTFGEAIAVSLDGGTVTQDEIIITISEDGTVGGTFTVKVEGPPKSSGDCHWQVFKTESGIISGQITQPTGIIDFEFEKKLELVRNCLDGNNTTLYNSNLDFTIIISRDTIMGSGPGGSFEATKQ